MKTFSLGDPTLLQVPTLIIEPFSPPNAKNAFIFEPKRLELFEVVKIGRKTSPKNPPESTNGIFDSKVLSRAHAEIKTEAGKVFIRDVGSSNGTFIGLERLGSEGVTSDWREIFNEAVIEFGVDILGDRGELQYSKVSCLIKVVGGLSFDSSLTSAAAAASTTSAPPNVNIAEKLQEEVEKSNQTRMALENLKQVLDVVELSVDKLPEVCFPSPYHEISAC